VAKKPGIHLHGVKIGRVWHNWPQWVRVTVGNAEEMQRFREVLRLKS